MELITERLILRDFIEDDWIPVFAYQTQPDYLRYYHWEGRTPEEVKLFVAKFLRRQQEQPRTNFQMAVCLKANGYLIGNCGVRKALVEDMQGDIGYELDPHYWGHGYATEAARAVVEYGFTHLKLHRLWAECIAENVASARVLQKVGMRLEGRLRESQFFKGRWWDTLRFGMLESEWHLNT